MDSAQDLPCGRGCPIRRSRDQRSLASPPGFSQRATSFIASWRQGIHQMPLPQRLIAKPVARRDKPRSQRVSHEDTLFELSAVGSQPSAKNSNLLLSRRRTTEDGRQMSLVPLSSSCCSDTPSSLCQRPQNADRREPAGKAFFLRSCAQWPANRSRAGSAPSSFALTRFGGQPPPLARRRLVEVNGIEPMTSCLQSRRSPN